MTIFQILMWWSIIGLIMWFIFAMVLRVVLYNKSMTLEIAIKLNLSYDIYLCKQNMIIEIIRFIVWPYGIIQRSIVLRKIYKESVN